MEGESRRLPRKEVTSALIALGAVTLVTGEMLRRRHKEITSIQTSTVALADEVLLYENVPTDFIRYPFYGNLFASGKREESPARIRYITSQDNMLSDWHVVKKELTEGKYRRKKKELERFRGALTRLANAVVAGEDLEEINWKEFGSKDEDKK